MLLVRGGTDCFIVFASSKQELHLQLLLAGKLDDKFLQFFRRRTFFFDHLDIQLEEELPIGAAGVDLSRHPHFNIVADIHSRTALYIENNMKWTFALRTEEKVRTSLRSPLSGADDGAPPPDRHQRCPRSLSHPGGLAEFQFAGDIDLV
ncbi:hypothetical protein ACLB2K_044648 [Fragaria x ananassa]